MQAIWQILRSVYELSVVGDVVLVSGGLCHSPESTQLDGAVRRFR